MQTNLHYDDHVGHDLDAMIEPYVNFVCERESIRRRRERGDSWPWTRDPILREWSFTNVHREDDRVTKWIAEHWRTPHADDPDLWFAMVISRFVNEPDTLAAIGYPVPWDPDHFLAVMAERKRRGLKLHRGDAYMIRADNSGRYTNTATYQAQEVFGPLWKARERLRPRDGDSLNYYHQSLMKYEFMAAQVVADLKQVEPLRSAPDWWTFAASGPGSRAGLNLIVGRPVKSRWDEREWRKVLNRLHIATKDDLDKNGIRLCAQDLQNCLCEWAKYERMRSGKGKPKRRYRQPPDKRGLLF